MASSSAQTDGAAYGAAGVTPAHMFLLRLLGEHHSGRVHADDRTLLAGLAALPPECVAP